MPGDSKANVIPLHKNAGRATAQRRAVQRHPATLGQHAERLTAIVHELDEQRAGEGAEPSPTDFARRVAAAAEFLRRRLTGDYQVDEFGFDPHFNHGIALPVLRVLFRDWFRVEVSGIENLPEQGAALVVANHAGVLPIDALMLTVAVHDHHPLHRDLRTLAADLVFDLPVIGSAARKAGHTMACTGDAHRLLQAGELTAVFPEGYKGLGKHYRDRYKLQRFGRGGFGAAALREGVPIVPCSIVGSEEIYPMLTDVKLLARLLGVPYFPITPLFPLAGPAGLVPLPSKWHIAFGEPIETAGYEPGAADDPMVMFELTDQVRETIQQTLYRLLASRRNVFFG